MAIHRQRTPEARLIDQSARTAFASTAEACYGAALISSSRVYNGATIIGGIERGTVTQHHADHGPKPIP